jgi:3-deoxy-D-manno-octulosonic-acid transferase
MSEKVVMLHGLSKDEVLTVMRLIKEQMNDPKDVAFCMTTPTNLDWTVKDVIKDVWEEHQYMIQNPPGGAGTS